MPYIQFHQVRHLEKTGNILIIYPVSGIHLNSGLLGRYSRANESADFFRPFFLAMEMFTIIPRMKFHKTGADAGGGFDLTGFRINKEAHVDASVAHSASRFRQG